MTALPAIRETRVRDRRGIYHRKVWVLETGWRGLVCEGSLAGCREVAAISDEAEEWQLCEGCHPRRSSDVAP
jgi:hypothetical protein